MKVACPSCGRSTHIDPELGDFPTRCQRCSSLLRRPVKSPEGILGEERSVAVSKRSATLMPIPQGGLAGLLSTRRPAGPVRGSRKGGEVMSVAPATPSEAPLETGAVMSETVAPSGSGSTSSTRAGASPSVDEVVHIQARQKAMRRAQLRGNHMTLGALNTLGFSLVAVLAVAAVVLGARSMWPTPSRARANVIELPAETGRAAPAVDEDAQPR